MSRREQHARHGLEAVWTQCVGMKRMYTMCDGWKRHKCGCNGDEKQEGMSERRMQVGKREDPECMRQIRSDVVMRKSDISENPHYSTPPNHRGAAVKLPYV